jgi:hypothetical protein
MTTGPSGARRAVPRAFHRVTFHAGATAGLADRSGKARLPPSHESGAELVLDAEGLGAG